MGFHVKIMQEVLMGAAVFLLLQVVGEFQEMVTFTGKFKEIDPFVFLVVWTFGVLLWNFLQEFLDAKVVLEFARSELMRCRLSSTTGNLVQLLMRSEVKLNHLERRSMYERAQVIDVQI